MPAAARVTGDPVVLRTWRARKLRPVVLWGVVLVFLAFMAVARFVVHSGEAVKALALAAVAALVPLLPGVINRQEFRLTDRGLDRRLHDPKKPREFRVVFAWADLAAVVPTRHGFKYARRLPPSGRARRFWNRHLSDAYSGEVQVEEADRAAVLAILADRVPAVTSGG